jgi:hypothetical protein
MKWHHVVYSREAGTFKDVSHESPGYLLLSLLFYSSRALQHICLMAFEHNDGSKGWHCLRFPEILERIAVELEDSDGYRARCATLLGSV